MDRSRQWVMGLVGILSICLFLGGCASGQKAKTSISNADLAIQRAREANAIINAPLELRLAEDKLQQARSTGDNDKAQRLADEALADARTAEAKSRAARTAQLEQQMQKDVNALRRESAPPAQPAPMGAPGQ